MNLGRDDGALGQGSECGGSSSEWVLDRFPGKIQEDLTVGFRWDITKAGIDDDPWLRPEQLRQWNGCS